MGFLPLSMQMQLSSIRLCLAIFILSTTAQAIQVAPLDAVQIGPYQVQNCKTNNNNIYTLLTTLRQTLQLGITDLGSSTSSDAYNTFFKDIANAPYVSEVFSNITKGASVPPEPGTPSSAPIFICVDGRDQVKFNENNRQVDAYTRCHTLDETPAMALLTTPYMIICPVFFTHPAIPVQSTASCLDVDPRRSRFVQDGKSLIKYQMWHILHELVHYYVYSTKGGHLDVYGINACLALRSAHAVLNAQSYTYYIANVRLRCTEFPRVRTRPSGHGVGVELLEIDANATVFNTNESIALVVQNVSVAVPPMQTPEDFDPDLTSRNLRKRETVYG